MDKTFWNERYADREYAYSKTVNTYIKKCIDRLPPSSKLLFPAEGEGRNAVYAARKGHQVYAFDMSERALEKCLKLSLEHSVEVNYHLGSLDEIAFDEHSFDAIGLGYFHLPPELRAAGYMKIMSWLRPEGYLFFEFFHKEQFGLSSGGPQRLDMLYDEELLRNDFDSIAFIELYKESLTLDEGSFHQGSAVVLHGFGKKKN